LRVLVNLTHSSASLCSRILADKFALPTLLRAICAPSLSTAPLGGAPATDANGSLEQIISPAIEEEYATRLFDRLCLALALLTNLVQEASGGSEVLRETRINPTCNVQFACAAGSCTCPDRVSALQCLAEAYVQQSASASAPAITMGGDQAEDAGAVFVRGHLAVLFGMLMRDCPANREPLLQVLSVASSSPEGAVIIELVEHASAFVNFYNAVSAANAHKGESLSSSDGNMVAEEALAFLRSLHDNI
jgi:hypothetical protein